MVRVGEREPRHSPRRPIARTPNTQNLEPRSVVNVLPPFRISSCRTLGSSGTTTTLSNVRLGCSSPPFVLFLFSLCAGEVRRRAQAAVRRGACERVPSALRRAGVVRGPVRAHYPDEAHVRGGAVSWGRLLALFGGREGDKDGFCPIGVPPVLFRLFAVHIGGPALRTLDWGSI